MNWCWLRSCRRVVRAGGLPDGRAGQLTWRKTTKRVVCAGLGVVLTGAAAGCSSPPGGSGPGPAAPAVSPSLLASRTAPDAPVGRQLTWFLRAVADLPWSQQLIRAHFDSGFLAQLSPAAINSALQEGLPALDASVPSAGASLTGVLWQDPARDPDSLLAVASFGRVQLAVNIAADRAGLISGLGISPYQPPPASWAQADRDLAGLAPDASLLAARVSPGGACTPVHQVAAAAARPLASMFKLFVLGALARQVAAGQVSWTQDLTVTGAVKSAGSGSLQDVPAGTRVSVRQAALQMISISDNTAADMLIHLVGRSAVQAQDQQWSAHAALNVPFLTTREAFLMKYFDPALAQRYLSLAPAQRAAFLASSVDPLPVTPAQLQNLGTSSPADIDTIEWFASPDDICRAFAGLQQLAAQPGLAPLGPILSANGGGTGLDPAQWPTLWYKGGSEPGVLTMGFLATTSNGQTFVVAAMLSNPAAALPPSATPELLAIVQGAFELAR